MDGGVVVVVVAGVVVVLALLWMLVVWHGEPFMTLKGFAAAVALGVLTFVATSIGLGWLVRVIQYRKTVWQILVAAGLSAVGWIGTNVHLWFFDPWFLKRGKIPPGEGKQKS